MKIKKVTAKEVPSSRGRMTVAASLVTEEGTYSASVPSGVSKGENEAVEVASQKAIKNIERIISPAFRGFRLGQQAKADKLLQKLDGTGDKHFLGANAILAVSLAYARASSFALNLPLWRYIAKIARTKPCLPTPFLLLIEGGKHGRGGMAMQELMFVPQTSTSSRSFQKKFQEAVAVYKKLGELLVEKNLESGLKLGLEGAFTPEVNEAQALDLIVQAIKRAGVLGAVGIDVAASTFLQENGKYLLGGKELSAAELQDFSLRLASDFPICFLEDPFGQNDARAWKALAGSVGPIRPMGRIGPISPIGRIGLMIVADDLTTTNVARMKMAKKEKLCNAVIIKPNQVGTLTETIAAALLAKKFSWPIVVSHRAGETNDSFIADLAVGLGASFIKTGSPSQEARMAKYKRLLAIEKEM